MRLLIAALFLLVVVTAHDHDHDHHDDHDDHDDHDIVDKDRGSTKLITRNNFIHDIFLKSDACSVFFFSYFYDSL